MKIFVKSRSLYSTFEKLKQDIQMILKILRAVLISIIQITFLYIVYDRLNHFYPIQHRTANFGLTIFYTGVIFLICLLVFNFYLEFFKRNIYCIVFLLLLITSIFPLSAFNERPLRSLFLLLLTICGFLSSLALNKWRMKEK